MTDQATVARFAAWLREREHLATPGLRDTAELLEAQATEIARLRTALRAVLLFYRPNWTPERQAEWEALTGQNEASTRTLCDVVRAALGDPPTPSRG